MCTLNDVLCHLNQYGVPQAILRRYAQDKTKTLAPTTKGMGGYKSIFENNKILPYRFNVNESAISTGQRPQKTFASTCQKQVEVLVSARKGSQVKVICYMSAGGPYIPPSLINPRKLMKKKIK